MNSNIKRILRKICCSVILLLAVLHAGAQDMPQACVVKNGRMNIVISKQLPASSIDSFVIQYNLEDLDLKNSIQNNSIDTLLKLGWKIELNNNTLLAISKKMGSVNNFKNPAASIGIKGMVNEKENLFPAISSTVKYGVNRFKNKNSFYISDSTVTFFLRGHTSARKVILAGSFNNWSTDVLRMTATDSGWIAPVKLGPGKYWYKFIIDGNWTIDKDNKLFENDGMGNENSVFYKPNYVFRSHSFTNAKKLFIAGSFNNWNENELAMTKTASGWMLPLYLADGVHTYRYIADGRWSVDPENADKLPNEFNDYNSVVYLGKQHIFRLDGFENASKVVLLGSFNNWKDHELLMNKVNNGWELPYPLDGGNYEYSFKVDGKWISGDNNSRLTNEADEANYFNLIVEPNYTFCLNGFENAKNIYLAGDFNNWSPNTFPLKKSGNEWMINIHFDKGKHRYKFIVDGKWILDPGNTLWEENEYGTGNSVVWIE